MNNDFKLKQPVRVQLSLREQIRRKPKMHAMFFICAVFAILYPLVGLDGHGFTAGAAVIAAMINYGT